MNNINIEDFELDSTYWAYNKSEGSKLYDVYKSKETKFDGLCIGCVFSVFNSTNDCISISTPMGPLNNGFSLISKEILTYYKSLS